MGNRPIAEEILLPEGEFLYSVGSEAACVYPINCCVDDINCIYYLGLTFPFGGQDDFYFVKCTIGPPAAAWAANPARA
jgi:hypothetical protein